VGSFRNRKINADLSSVHVSARQGSTSLASIFSVFIVDKCESPAPAAVAIQDNLNPLQGSKLAKFLLQLPLCGVQTQPENSQTIAPLRRFPIPLVAPPVGHGGTGMCFSTSLVAICRTGSGSRARPPVSRGSCPRSTAGRHRDLWLLIHENNQEQETKLELEIKLLF